MPKAKRRKVDNFKDIAGAFRGVPLLAIRRIVYFLSITDKKSMRCLSSWFYEMLTLELRSDFDTLTVPMIGCDNYDDIFTTIVTAMERPMGHLFKLRLEFCSNFHQLLTQGILLMYKENILSLDMCIKSQGCTYLLDPHCVFNQLATLSLSFPDIQDQNQVQNEFSIKHIVENLIAKCGHNLVSLSLEDLSMSYDNCLQLPEMPLISNLCLSKVDGASAMAIIKSTNRDNIKELSLDQVYFAALEIIDLSLPFRNIKCLRLKKLNEGAALTLIRACREHITELYLTDFIFTYNDIQDLQIPNLDLLSLEKINGPAVVYLLRAFKETVTKLELIGDMVHPYIFHIEIPTALRYLSLSNMSGYSASVFIKTAKDTLTKLVLDNINFTNVFFGRRFKLNSLKSLETDSVKKTKALFFVRESKNLTKLRIDDTVYSSSEVVFKRNSLLVEANSKSTQTPSWWK